MEKVEAEEEEDVLRTALEGTKVGGEEGLLPLSLKGKVTSAAIEGGDALEDARSEALNEKKNTD